MGAKLGNNDGLPVNGGHAPGSLTYQPGDQNSVLEIIAFILLIGATIWVAPLLSRRAVTARDIGYGFAGVITLLIFGSEVLHHERPADVGLRLDNFGRALGLLAMPTAGLSLLLMAIGTGLGSLHFTERAIVNFHFEWYGWLLIQQYLLQGFLNRRLQDVFGKGRESVLLTAIVFAGFHLPNPALMVATAVAGIFWARIYQREPNLFALALSHLILSFTLSHSLPVWILPNARIGWAFHW